MLHFCTYFDSNYLVRFLPMYRSLARHCREKYRLHVLCLDEAAYETITKLDLADVIPVKLATIEAADPALAQTKTTRQRYEYYFTITPSWILYLLESGSDIDRITYLDADLYFYSDPRPLFEEIGDGSVGIVPHRFPPRLKYMEQCGKYNVAFVYFRHDGRGLACLRWWRSKCIEWCYDRREEGRFADQKYLDEFPTRFEGVHVIDNIGADVGPWNAESFPVTRRSGNIMVGDVPLIFYHFEGYRQEAPQLIDPGICRYGVPLAKALINAVHIPYVNEVLACRRLLDRCHVNIRGTGDTRKTVHSREGNVSWLCGFRRYLEGRYVWCFAGRAWYCESRMARNIVSTYDALRGLFTRTKQA